VIELINEAPALRSKTSEFQPRTALVRRQVS